MLQIGGIEMARPSVNKDYWTSPDGIAIISQWRRNGCTHEEIARKIEVTTVTLWRWSDASVELCKALKLNKELADTMLENRAMQMAMEGNTAMMIFLLKNRMSGKYAEKTITDLNVNAEIENIAKAFKDSVNK